MSNNEEKDINATEETLRQSNVRPIHSETGSNRTLNAIVVFIQALANIAICATLIFSLIQHVTTLEPVKQNQKLSKAQSFINLGMYSDAMDIYTALEKDELPVALNNMGYLYHKGLGVEQNTEKAIEYYKKASAYGSDLAINNLISLYYEFDFNESKETLADYFCAAYELQNEERTLCALTLIDADIEYDNLFTGNYENLFENNGKEYRKKFYQIPIVKDDVWKPVVTFNSPTSDKSYTGSSSKCVLEGREVKKDDSGYYGILYKYTIYERVQKGTLDLQTGFEKVMSIDGR